MGAVTAHTAMARGLLMPSPLPLLRLSLRLMPTTWGVDMALAMVVTATARGLLMLTTAMAAMAHTAMARGPLMPMPTTAMAVMAHTAMGRGLLMLMPTTAATMVATVMARGPLMLTTDSATAMAAMAHTTDKLQTVSKREDTSEIKPNFVCCFQKCQELI